MTIPRWKQIFDEWRARISRPLVDNGIAEGMRQQALSPRQVTLTAEQKLKSLEARRPGGAAGSLQADICQWCLNPFTYTVKRSGKHRDSIEYEPLRKILRITDYAFDPVICDGCFDQVTKSALPDDKLSPGMCNAQHPNLLLH